LKRGEWKVKTRLGGRCSGIAAGCVLVGLALALVGCEGDDGSSGAQGPTGNPGPAGPPGESGVSIEDGAAVQIGDGSALDAETIEAIGGLVATIDDATISSPPVIEFTVKTVHGGPAEGIDADSLLFTVAKLVPKTDGIPARWQSYINRVQNSSSSGPQVLPSAVQANSERGGAGELADLGDGKYRYTYGVDLENVMTPIAVAYEPMLTHRLGFEIRLSGDAEPLAPDNPVIDVVPDEGTGSGHKRIAATENCEACHVRFAMHGGPRRSVEYCVTCHNPGTVDPDGGESVDLAYLAHSIHAGHDRAVAYIVYGFGGTAHDYGEVTYPQSTLFCESCHVQSNAAPDGDVWMVNSSASACGGCHVEGLGKTGPDESTGLYTYTYQHSAFDYNAPDGVCEACHVEGGAGGSTLANHTAGARLQKTLGDNFLFEILDVTNVGEGLVPEITIRISDSAGQPYDILTSGSFDEDNGATLNLYLAWDTGDIANALSDGTLITTGNECRSPGDVRDQERGYPYRMRIGCIKPAAVANDDGSFTVTFFTALPAVTGEVMVVMDGHPVAIPDGGTEYSRATPVNTYWPPDDASSARARLVSMEKCDACHVRLSLHGGNRNGDPQGCVVCHNSSGGFSDEPDVGGPIAMGPFIHALHAGKVPGVGVEGAVTYPQSLANCEACHIAGTYFAARMEALPISTGPGASELTVADDTWSSATAGTCAACHGSGSARSHMASNGGVFDQAGGKLLQPTSAFEACSVCHGPGRVADTVAAHKGHGH